MESIVERFKRIQKMLHDEITKLDDEINALKENIECREQMETSNFSIEGYIEIVDPEEAELMMQQEGKQ